ncbi:minor capsid protein [Patescibacteria group bacterium]|nr:minor capsid protein [Patescibacteria group bacterium]
MSHDNTPAEILRASLVAGGVGVLRSKNSTGAWPIFVGHIPSEPDDAVCVYDTAGIREGRMQGTGESVGKPGFQVMVRGADHTTAYARMKLVASHLDSLLRERVAIDGDSYTIQAVKQTGTILALGQEPDGQRRNLFTLNGTITYVQNT